MPTEISVNWFLAQVALCVAAWLIGRAIGRGSRAWGEILLATMAAMSVAWALRDRAASVLLGLFPLDAWIYLEGTVIAPPLVLVAGAISVHPTNVRARWLGPALGAFGLAYFGFHGSWMVRPAPSPATLETVRSDQGATAQSRYDSCTAAAMATAVRSLNIGLVVSEADMAHFADLRAGAGSTPARVLRGLRMALTGTRLDASLMSLSAAEVAHVASADRPALVTLRSSATQHHMVVLYGVRPDGRLSIFNPSTTPCAAGVEAMEFDDFRRRYTGAAIVMLPRPNAVAASRAASATLGAH